MAEIASLASVGDRAREALALRRLRQRDFSKRTGVSESYLSEVLSGSKHASVELLMLLKRDLGVSIDWLLTGEGDSGLDLRAASHGQ